MTPREGEEVVFNDVISDAVCTPQSLSVIIYLMIALLKLRWISTAWQYKLCNVIKLEGVNIEMVIKICVW